MSLLAFPRGDDFHLQVVSEVNWYFGYCQMPRFVYFIFYEKRRRENYEPFLAAIQFPQEILAFFEEHATACSEESLYETKRQQHCCSFSMDR